MEKLQSNSKYKHNNIVFPTSIIQFTIATYKMYS